MRISDWSSDVCSSDLGDRGARGGDRLRAGVVIGPPEILAGDQFLDLVARQRFIFEQRARERVELGEMLGQHRLGLGEPPQIGRAPCRERVCQYVSISVVDVSLKKKQTTKT